MTRSTRRARRARFTTFRQITFAVALLSLLGNGSLASAQNTASTPNPAPAPAQGNPTPEIAFSDAAPQLLSPKRDGAFEFDVALRNAGKQPGTPAFALVGDGCGKVQPVTPPTYGLLKPGAVAIQKLRISGAKLPATCHLELQTQEDASANQSLKQLKLAQHYLTWFFLYWLWGCLIASVLAIGVALFLAFPTGKDLHLLAPAWDFTKSWTSNLTFAGGVVSGALALSALPELTHHASKAGYATVALLLSFSILVAPLLAALLASGSITKDTSFKATVMHVATWCFSISRAWSRWQLAWRRSSCSSFCCMKSFEAAKARTVGSAR